MYFLQPLPELNDQIKQFRILTSHNGERQEINQGLTIVDTPNKNPSKLITPLARYSHEKSLRQTMCLDDLNSIPLQCNRKAKARLEIYLQYESKVDELVAHRMGQAPNQRSMQNMNIVNRGNTKSIETTCKQPCYWLPEQAKDEEVRKA